MRIYTNKEIQLIQEFLLFIGITLLFIMMLIFISVLDYQLDKAKERKLEARSRYENYVETKREPIIIDE